MAHQVYISSKQLLFEIESSAQWNHQFDFKKFFIDRLLQIKDQRPWEDRKVTKPNPTNKEELFKDVVGFLTFGNDLYFEQKKREEERLAQTINRLVVNNLKHSQNQKPIKIFKVGDVVDLRGAVANQWEIGCTIINVDLNHRGGGGGGVGSEYEYDIKDCKGVIKQNVPQSNIKPTLQDFYTIESLHCILQEFLSERDFTWKLLYNFVLQDEFRKTIDK